jgi:hypothetical protein
MEYFELNINQRQKEDPIYADLLNRIRVGNQNAQDIKSLKSKVIPDKHNNKIANAAEFYIDLIKEKPQTITLFSKTTDVAEFNGLINLKLGKVYKKYTD